MKTNYQIFRGKCKEACEALLIALPELELVRGHVIQIDGQKDPHWWLRSHQGTIVDPTVAQFTCGVMEYVEFDGYVNCAECGKRLHEKETLFHGNYPVCSDACALALVGL